MPRSRIEFVQEYADPEYAIPDHWTKDSLTLVECKRLARASMTARIAVEIPRRLGSDASGRDLSADKKLSRRLGYVYMSLWNRLVHSTHAPLPPESCPEDLLPPRNWKQLYVIASSNDDIRKAGITIDWNDWWDELRPRLLARRMVVASFAVDRGEANWGYRMVSGISDEIGWVDEKIDAYRRSTRKVAA